MKRFKQNEPFCCLKKMHEAKKKKELQKEQEEETGRRRCICNYLFCILLFICCKYVPILNRYVQVSHIKSYFHLH